MTNNDFLRRFRYVLNIKDNVMIEIFKLANREIKKDELLGFLKRDTEEGYKKINNQDLLLFLDGLIIYNRGKKENLEKPLEIKITKNNLNNILLRKLRIALSFKSYDMIKIFKLGGVNISEGELSALFRKEGHPNYRECGDKYIRTFLKGLVDYYRN